MSEFAPLKISDKQKSQLQSLGIFSYDQLISYYPYRYENVTESDLQQAAINEKVCFSGRIIGEVATFFHGKLRRHTFKVEVKGYLYSAVIFNRPWIAKASGKTLTFFGNKQGNNQLLITNYNAQDLKSQLGLQAYYRQNKEITNKQIKLLIAKALALLVPGVDLPPAIIRKYAFIDLVQAYNNIHQPTSAGLLYEALSRLKYHELFFFNLQLLYQKQHYKALKKAKVFDRSKITAFIEKLPYTLKNSQKSAITEILDDLSQPYTMLRLLQGEVGSGKTIVAFIAMYACLLAGQQSVLLAPTEILAKQHYENLLRYFKKEEVAVLVATLSTAELKRTLQAIASNQVKIICGTHRVFQDDVNFAALGLVIADEQQRFGVIQRQKLIDKGENVDVLQMSATPIPRTIAMYLYADMDVSSLAESVFPREKIETHFIKENSFFSIKGEIEGLLDQGNLAYIVCASIAGTGDKTRNVVTLVNSLKKHYKDRYEVAGIHSKTPQEQQESLMKDFKAKKIQILVCTSIVEVGIDVKDANIMVIYDSERFGLSQLHQLRGRIGRQERKGYCYLLSGSVDEEVSERLEFIAQHNSGQDIAMYDFHRRGFGDIAGIRQSGKQFFQLIDVTQDLALVQECYQDAKDYLQQAENDDSLFTKLNFDSIISN